MARISGINGGVNTAVTNFNDLEPDEWDALLSIWEAPVPRILVRIREKLSRYDMIRQRIREGVKTTAIMAEFGISQSMVSKIKNGHR